eukprot:3895832-Prymnesium_polylepis.1
MMLSHSDTAFGYSRTVHAHKRKDIPHFRIVSGYGNYPDTSGYIRIHSDTSGYIRIQYLDTRCSDTTVRQSD